MATGPTPWKIGINEDDLRAGAWPVLRGLLLVFGTAGSIFLFDRFYGLIALSLVWFPYVLFNPREGLWINPSFFLVASLTCPPEGFVAGAGYSPELTYWAIGICVLFVPMSIRYLKPGKGSYSPARNQPNLAPPRGFYAFAAMSLVATAVGLAHGYSLQNVGKQFFGCAFLCAYFLFVLRFAPRQEDMEHVIDRVIYVAIICSVIYMLMFFDLFSQANFSKHLTAIAFYDGGPFVLLIPRILTGKGRIRMDRTLIVALFLFAVPLFTQMKRVVLACFLCGLIAWGLQSASRRRRYLYLATAFLLLVIVLSTSVLNPIGSWFSKLTGWENLIPEDVQSHYSVFLRLEEFRQVIGTVADSPVFGGGLGSTLNWYDPITRTNWEWETVGDGLLYLLAKMGIAGTIAFLWFIVPLGTAALRKPITGLHLGLFLLLVFNLLQMVADVTFFYFMTAGWVGTTCAFLYILNRNSEAQTATPV
jgi:hypothetical protein